MVRGGQTLLKDVSMHIHCGQITALIGQNGAGKTTLIRALLGQLPHGGSIHHLDGQGRDIPHLRTGYVPQHLDFDKEMPLTVEDFLAAAFSRRPVWTGISKKTRAQVMEALAGVEAGVWGSLEEVAALRRSQHVFLPQRPQAACEAQYRLWRRAVDRALRWIENDV